MSRRLRPGSVGPLTSVGQREEGDAAWASARAITSIAGWTQDGDRLDSRRTRTTFSNDTGAWMVDCHSGAVVERTLAGRNAPCIQPRVTPVHTV